ncbi:major facilitator superfamily domain-containing protein [Hygrophoropsis aurantiaca]|uniref:Major facilitator superfamily domain-containing protein n=1 Tax=Hygrophoropsis aurantiaca TaxID=72124 RepID=A0ACB8AE66_9AGAM|nr:major facilitator superfamily domain-containing protein [Hygrophoropsis aurantiaca]
MASEDSPLLYPSSYESEHEAVYKRFSDGQKRTIVVVVSLAGLLPMFVSGTFVPSIPEIAHDLESTAAVVSLAISLSILSGAIGSLVWASYSTYYGRRPIFLIGLPLLCLGSFGVATSRYLPTLLFWRCIQALGSAGGLALGPGIIGDIYKLEERGAAIGAFFGASLFGLAIAPLGGGLAAQYASWRQIHVILGAWGLLEFILVYFILPETSHPGARGIDKVDESRRSRFVWINPLRSLLLLRSPNLLAIALAGALSLLTDYVLLVPLGVRYGITNDALIGACFLPNGLGNFLGAPLAGRLSDIVVKRWRKKRKGEWVPEDRLRATFIGGLILVPFSVASSGFITTYVDGPVGLGLNLLCLFTNGLGVDFVLSPSSAYGVDLLHSRSAEVIAATTAFRSLILSLGASAVIPMIGYVGVAGTNCIAAVLAWIGYGLIWFTIRHGDRMRAWVDVGYSTAQNN